MAKTDLQIQSFLAENSYRSKIDWDMISAFCKDKAEFSINTEYNPEQGITASDFIHWYENGFGAGDIAKMEGNIVIIGKTDFKATVIVGILSDDKILISHTKIATEGLKMASESEIKEFRHIMLRDRIQFSWRSFDLVEKYIPHINERIIFHGVGIKGLGVVREVDMLTGEVELYCYYIYTTKRCGYTMHEKGICNLHDYIFEPMDNGNKRQSKMNGISCQRRLNSELGKFGKVWNQSRHRVEPVRMQTEIGKRYWYINDKLCLVSDVEKGLQTSRNRALAGNYFINVEHGTEVMGKIVEIIREYLASPESSIKK